MLDNCPDAVNQQCFNRYQNKGSGTNATMGTLKVVRCIKDSFTYF